MNAKTQSLSRSLPDPRLAFVDCMVKATSFEQLTLWCAHSEESGSARDPIQWTDSSLSRGKKIGELGGLPVCVMWRFAVVGGAVLCFYEATSRAVDHQMVREWADGICRQHVDAHNFHNRPQPDRATENVTKWTAAEEEIRAAMIAEAGARMAEHRAERCRIAELQRLALAANTADERAVAADALHEFIDRDDAALAERGIPAIDDDRLVELVARCIPVDAQTHRSIELTDLRRTASTWSPSLGDEVRGLVPAKVVKTLHTYGATIFFKPSIAEVLAQAPDDVDRYVAFSTAGPGGADDMNRFPECTNAGYHVAKTTFYVRGEA